MILSRKSGSGVSTVQKLAMLHPGAAIDMFDNKTFWTRPGSVTTNEPAKERLIVAPLIVMEAVTLDKLLMQFTGAVASSVMHWGLYHLDSTSRLPTTRIIQKEQSGAAEGTKKLEALEQVLEPGIYGEAQLATGAVPKMKGMQIRSSFFPAANATELAQIEGNNSGLFIGGKTELPADLTAEAANWSWISSITSFGYKKL